jgi:hypothetical protein
VKADPLIPVLIFVSVCTQYMHQPVRCAVQWASYSEAGPKLTDNEAGYGHSIILVNSDDSCDLRSVSMLCRTNLWRTKPKARGGTNVVRFPMFRFAGAAATENHRQDPVANCARSHVTSSAGLPGSLVAVPKYFTSSDRTLLRIKRSS